MAEFGAWQESEYIEGLWERTAIDPQGKHITEVADLQYRVFDIREEYPTDLARRYRLPFQVDPPSDMDEGSLMIRSMKIASARTHQRIEFLSADGLTRQVVSPTLFAMRISTNVTDPLCVVFQDRTDHSVRSFPAFLALVYSGSELHSVEMTVEEVSTSTLGPVSTSEIFNYILSASKMKIREERYAAEDILEIEIQEKFGSRTHPTPSLILKVAKACEFMVADLFKPADLTMQASLKLLRSVAYSDTIARVIMKVYRADDSTLLSLQENAKSHDPKLLETLKNVIQRANFSLFDGLKKRKFISRNLRLSKFNADGYLWADTTIDESPDAEEGEVHDLVIRRGRKRFMDQQLAIQEHSFIIIPSIDPKRDELSITSLTRGRQNFTAQIPMQIPYKEIISVYNDPDGDFRQIRALLGIQFVR